MEKEQKLCLCTECSLETVCTKMQGIQNVFVVLLHTEQWGYDFIDILPNYYATYIEAAKAGIEALEAEAKQVTTSDTVTVNRAKRFVVRQLQVS